jgi:amino acid adenylation domain-containing protein
MTETREKDEHRPGGLVSGFFRSVEKFPTRPAVSAGVGAGELSYEQLYARASQVCAALGDLDGGARALVAVLGDRSVETFAGILGSLLRGHGYVPLSPEYPIARTCEMLVRSGARTLVVDAAGQQRLPALLDGVDVPLGIIALGAEGTRELEARWPRHRFVAAAALPRPTDARLRAPRPEDPAYVLFTSGTTGRPKAVAVTHANVRSFLDAATARFRPTCEDRFSQTFALTFDLSVFDLFVAWESGACVCCASEEDRLTPWRYVVDAGLTLWFSVPSAAQMMARMRQLKPNQYPGLRWSLFCGEALPQAIAEQWAAAAPNSTVENLYGPTELTIACTSYRWEPGKSEQECVNGIVPIGWPLPGMSARVVDDSLSDVDPGAKGELVMTGPQMTPGYLDDPEKTSTSFVHLGPASAVHYRTGDIVRRPIGHEPMVFFGRADTQIKIRGFRVELGEIEAAVREETGGLTAVAVPWPRTVSGADGIVVFVEGSAVDGPALVARVRDRLPTYMHPREIRGVAGLPRNANGKIDRRAVEALLGSAPV